MATPLWEAGTLYQPGALVRPLSAPSITVEAPSNPNLEDGDTGWTFGDPLITIVHAGPTFNGTGAIQWDDNLFGTFSFVNDRIVPVKVGQTINATCRHRRGTDNKNRQGSLIGIQWLDGDYDLVSISKGVIRQSGDNGPWYELTVSAVAPPGAIFAQIYVEGYNNDDGGNHTLRWDAFTWDYHFQGIPDGLVFKAVQATAGYSGATEPTWPTVNGAQVVDNEVTWEAAFATRVTWEASPVLVSGADEPVWPTAFGGTVEDNTIAWKAMDHRVTDPKCPNSKVVAIAASKIFAVDDDIVAFSATVNPLDWSTPEDAGYLPFGLQTYGSTPAQALGLYRSNLVVFNNEGYQMWQVDEDPANMALLDASPIDCPYPKSVQPASNDLVCLTSLGVRNIGVAGASTNFQAGFFGKQIDPLVMADVKALDQDENEPLALFWPGAGQYWLMFNKLDEDDQPVCEAFVLTMNGGPKDMSWSRYLFEGVWITDWAILSVELYLRTSSGLVWRVSEDALFDDTICSGPEGIQVTFEAGIGESGTGYNDTDYGEEIGVLVSSTFVDPIFVGIYSRFGDGGFVELLLANPDLEGAPPDDNVYETIYIYDNSGDVPVLLSTLNLADAGETAFDLNYRWWIWEGQDVENVFDGGSGQSFKVTTAPISSGDDCTGTDFLGRIWWPYLDFGVLGIEKTLEGFDLVCSGQVNVTFGYDQRNLALATPAYLVDGDTLPGTAVPMPLTGPSFQFRLDFEPGQAWSWEAANIYQLGELMPQ